MTTLILCKERYFFNLRLIISLYIKGLSNVINAAYYALIGSRIDHSVGDAYLSQKQSGHKKQKDRRVANLALPGPPYLIPGNSNRGYGTSKRLRSKWLSSGCFFGLSLLNPVSEFFCLVRKLSRRSVKQITI